MIAMTIFVDDETSPPLKYPDIVVSPAASDESTNGIAPIINAAIATRTRILFIAVGLTLTLINVLGKKGENTPVTGGFGQNLLRIKDWGT